MVKNSFTLYKKNKELIYLITIQPILIFLLMSFLLPYSSTHNLVISNESNSEVAEKVVDNLKSLEGISVKEIDADKVTEKLIGGNAELALVITDLQDEDILEVSLVSITESEIENAVQLCIDDTISSVKSGIYNGETDTSSIVSVNETKKKWISISNSLAFMIFKTLTAGNLLGALIIEERRKRMKDRIMLSGMKKSSYFLGMSSVYLMFMMTGSIIYYLVGLVLNFDFGMRNSLGFLLMLFISNILSISIYVFFAALLKKEDALGFVGTFILMPMSLFSGVLFPFKYMPEVMQKIGACFPQRWIAHGIENIQQTGTVQSCFKDAVMVLALSIVLFVIGINFDNEHKKMKRRV
ncbi:MAG: ABC transporter permease [Eubacterium sp.]|nr:ABC transporter permease [Eubacterium sp.]